MINDRIENLYKYISISNELNTIISFIENKNLKNLPIGQKNVINDNVYYNVDYYLGKNRKDTYFEAHNLYLDLQLVVENREIIDFNLCNDNLKKIKSYPENDVYFGEIDSFSSVIVNENEFVIFFPNELHRPCIRVNDKKVKKIVFKLKMQ